MQHTSNHSWNAGDRPSLRITAAGIELLAYLDYVTPRTFISLAPTDTSIPEQYDDERQPLERKDVTPHVDEFDHEDDIYDDNAIPDLPLNGGDDFDDMDDDEREYGKHSPEED